MGSGDQRATEMEVMQMYHDQSFGIRSELAISETSMDMLNMVTFSLRNNIDNVPIDDVSAHLQIDVKAQQEELGEKLGIKCSVIAFLNENLGKSWV